MRTIVGRNEWRVLYSGAMQEKHLHSILTANDKSFNSSFIQPSICGFSDTAMPYPDVMRRMAGTSVNSARTSSLPLAQLLRPSPKSDGLLRLIGSRCGNGESAGEPLARYLEYPVWPRHPRSGRPFAQPSMSDAMLLGDHVRIAVEGKWTEPHYGPYQTVREWLDDRQPGAPTQKPAVLAAWLADIRTAGALRRGVTMDAVKTIPYQLVHRAASACRDAGGSTGVRPVLCYVVFRDPKATAVEAAMTATFEASLLGRWTWWLDPASIDVLLVRVPVVKEPGKRRPEDAKLLFHDIGAGGEPYGFDWESIQVVHAADHRANLLQSPESRELRNAVREVTAEPRLRRRINREVAFLCETGLAPSMLLLQRLASALRRRGIEVGPGRCALAESATAFALGATRIDPIRFHLPFGMFLAEWSCESPRFEFDIPSGRDIEAEAEKVVAEVAAAHGLQAVRVCHARSLQNVPESGPAFQSFVLLDDSCAKSIPMENVPWSSLPVASRPLRDLRRLDFPVITLLPDPMLTAIREASAASGIDPDAISLDDPVALARIRNGEINGPTWFLTEATQARMRENPPNSIVDLARLLSPHPGDALSGSVAGHAIRILFASASMSSSFGSL